MSPLKKKLTKSFWKLRYIKMPGNRFIFQLIKSSVQTSLGKRRQSLPISGLILVSFMAKQGGRRKVVFGDVVYCSFIELIFFS